MTRHTFTTCLSFGTDGEADYCELDATVSFGVTWGRGETPPAYAHGGLPADPDEIDDIRVEAIDGRPVTASDCLTVEAILAEFEGGDHDDALFQVAREDAFEDAIAAAEHRAELRAELRAGAW
jgi:hypothetical protein